MKSKHKKSWNNIKSENKMNPWEKRSRVTGSRTNPGASECHKGRDPESDSWTVRLSGIRSALTNAIRKVAGVPPLPGPSHRDRGTVTGARGSRRTDHHIGWSGEGRARLCGARGSGVPNERIGAIFGLQSDSRK